MMVPHTMMPSIIALPKDGGARDVGYIGPHANLVREGYVVIVCDGRTYDPARYRQLAAVIGDDFGMQNGLPRVPDMCHAAMGASMAVPPRR
jgi:hypothetical protein